MTTDHDDDADLAPVTDLFGARSRRAAPAPDTGAPDNDSDIDADADAPVPLPIQGARAQAEWLQPVVGDGSGRSARAEQDGYDEDHTADATTASVFAIDSGAEIDPADAPRPVDE